MVNLFLVDTKVSTDTFNSKVNGEELANHIYNSQKNDCIGSKGYNEC